MDLRQIRYALAVAKERSFTRASARVNISQSAVSAQIKLLEGEVGFPIFFRSTRGIELTEAGRTFLLEAERMMSDLLNLTETARRLRGGTTETLSLGMVSGAAAIFVPRIFGDLAQFGTDITLRLVVAPTQNIFSELQEEKIDAGIAIESEPDRVPAGLRFDRLAETEMAIIVPAKHRFAKFRKTVNVSDLWSEPIIMSELTVGYGQLVLSIFADFGKRPKIRAIANNIETIRVIVESGAGIAIVPRASIPAETLTKRLSLLRLSPPRKVAFALYRRREPLSRPKELFLDSLRHVLGVR